MELWLEHTYKDKVLGRQRITPDQPVIIIGSHQRADIHLLGEDVSGIHAMLEFNDEHWSISDLNSRAGTWVKKEAIVSQDINNETVVRIGMHKLTVSPHNPKRKLFENLDKVKSSSTEGSLYHQVIVRKNGIVIESHILSAQDPYTFTFGDETTVLQPPEEKNWKTKSFGNIVVMQRLAMSQVITQSSKEVVSDFFDPSLKTPMMVSSGLFLLVLALILLFPQMPDDEMPVLQKENQYTKIIYDAKTIRKKRLAAKKQVKALASSSSRRRLVRPSSVLKKRFSKSSNKNNSKNAVTISNRLKKAGLSRLIGKISKRAAKSAKFITRQGKSPDDPTTGRSLASVGSLKSGGKKKAGKFKIAGIQTSGKAGGSQSYKNFGGLSAGGIGQSSVGIIDEETEIQGGLDREVIAQVIRSQLGQIRYCYERQLSASPDLYGKVLVKFTIGGQGAVGTRSIGKTTLKNSMVEGCILRRVASWKFPKPKVGTNGHVSYPFLFKSTN